jgi:hypothetical protein
VAQQRNYRLVSRAQLVMQPGTVQCAKCLIQETLFLARLATGLYSNHQLASKQMKRFILFVWVPYARCGLTLGLHGTWTCCTEHLVLRENLLPRHVVHHKSHVTWDRAAAITACDRMGLCLPAGQQHRWEHLQARSEQLVSMGGSGEWGTVLDM